MLGLALVGAAHPLLRAAPAGSAAARSAIDSSTDDALAAIAADPACALASLSVLALGAGRPIYEAQFGLRSIAARLPANAATLYRIASVSKLMTTIGVMRLVERGQLDLDADVARYLGFSLRNPHFPARAITLRALLTHTSSLRDDGGYAWPLTTTLATGLNSDGIWASNAAAGDYFSYCNLGWGVIGTIMERVSGERFDRLMARLLLGPLGLAGGYYAPALAPAQIGNLATLYRQRAVDSERWDSSGGWIAQADDFHGVLPPAPAALDSYVPGTNATPFSPTGGLRISARDLGVVMQMLIGGGVHQGVRVLHRATVEAMFVRQWTFEPARQNGDTSDGLFQAWGLGNQQFIDGPGQRLIADASAGASAGAPFNGVGHLGDAYGLRSLFIVDRARASGFVVLIGGTASDPDAKQGAHSRLAAVEERVLDVLWQRSRHG